MTWYREGTVSVANGATAVTGTTTGWFNVIKGGDLITFDGGAKFYEIAANPASNTALTLATAFAETTISGGAYAIVPVSPKHAILPELAAEIRAKLSKATRVLTAAGAPSDTLGIDGDHYIRTSPLSFYGPKAEGVWPAAVPMLGTTMRYGAGAPSSGDGLDGDFWIDQANHRLYGPKDAGAWASEYVSLIGPTGANGKTILNGAGAPSNGTGLDGDFWIDTTNSRLYGPKAAGAWPGGYVSLIGPASAEALAAARTFFVRTDGSDANTGLVDTAAGAFRTIPKAIEAAARLVLQGFDVTISVGNGTYTEPVILRPLVGFGAVQIIGNVASPADCVISTTGASAISASGNVHGYTITGFRVQTTTSGFGVSVAGGSRISLGIMDFGVVAAGFAHAIASSYGQIVFSLNYSISGSAEAHWRVGGGLILAAQRTITLSGTPNFATAFCVSDVTGVATVWGNIFSGAATGARYAATNNAIINTLGAGATYLPGNAAGSASAGGLYI